MISTVAWTLLEVTAVLAVTRRVAPRFGSASARHRAYASALALTLALPAAAWLTPGWSPAPLDDLIVQLEQALTVPAAGSTATTSAPGLAAGTARVSISPVTIAALGWTLGALLSLTVLIRATYRRGVIAGGALPIDDGPLHDALQDAIERVGPRRAIRLLLSSDIEVPATWGVFRSTVLLPDAATRWPRQQLDAVLLHELAHLRRSDARTRLLAQITTVVYWFHPLVRITVSALYDEAELACDRVVVEQGHDRLDYAEMLLAFAGRASAPLSAGVSSPPLTRRIDALLANTAASERRLLVRALATAAIAGVVLAAALIGPPTAAAAKPRPSDADLTEYACIERSAMRVSLASTGPYQIGESAAPFRAAPGHRLVARAWIRLPDQPGCPAADPGQIRVEASTTLEGTVTLAAWYGGRPLPANSPVPALLAGAILVDEERRRLDIPTHTRPSNDIPSAR